MIKFFRRIRRKLLSEQKITKYLLYGGGEIILVVIGILLALAINDWRNLQRIHSEEEATLRKLIQDLKTDSIRYTNNIQFYSEYNDDLISSYEIIFKKSITDDEIEKVMGYQGAIHKSLNPRRTTYNEMINSGRIYNISDNTLVNQIIDYYQFLDESIDENKEQRKEFRALFYAPDFTDFWFWKGDKNAFPDAKSFFENKDSYAYKRLKQTSAWSLFINEGLLKNNEGLLEMNSDLIRAINTQLESRK